MWHIGKIAVVGVCMMVTMAGSSAAATTLKIGSTGRDVVMLQRQLRKMGYNIKDDGMYSAETSKAVADFQQKQHLQASGTVGNWTYYLLTGKRHSLLADEQVKNATFVREEIPRTKKHSVSIRDLADQRKLMKPRLILAKSLREEHISRPLNRFGKQVVASAYKYLGVPYVFGGNTPDGFDCSGFTRYVFSHNGVQLPRMANEQYQVGEKIEKEKLLPGDLVFFSTYIADDISHIGIYVGEHQFISATTSGGIRVDDLESEYWSIRYIGAKRIRL